MSRTATVVMLLFTVKVLAVVFWGHVLRPRLSGLLESAVAAWVSVQVAVLAALLLLSAFTAVRGWTVWCSLLIIAASGAWAAMAATPKGINSTDFRTLASREATIAVLCLLCVFALLAFRSFVFSDLTWDAQTYGLPRIAFWAKHQTLFVVQPTSAINIFSNEWNGEANALVYAVGSGSDVAAAFGNVEVWLFACLSLAWLTQLFGARLRLALMCGLVLATTPSLLGLSMTVKGDLMSTAAMAAAVGFGIQHLRSARIGASYAWTPALALAAAGLAAGAKIVLLPSVIPFAALLCMWVGSAHPNARSIRVLTAGLSAFVVGCARYVVNYVQFGDAFSRVDTGGTISLVTLMGNLHGLVEECFDIVTDGLNPPYFWALSSGLGFLSVGLVVWLCIGLGARDASATRRVPSTKRRHTIFTAEVWVLAIPLAAGLSAALLAIPWQPWSLRYFDAWLMIGLAWLLALPFRFVSGFLTRSTVTLWMLVISANLWLAFGRPGEALPMSFSEALHHTPTERKFATFPGMYVGDGGLKEVIFDSPRALRILVSNPLDSFIYAFFGRNYQHDVELTTTSNRLVNRVLHERYDLVVFTGPPEPDETRLGAFLGRLGYTMKIGSSHWRVYAHRTG